MRVADSVSSLELAEYQQAARAVLRHPLISAGYPDRTTLPLVRKWASQLRKDFAEVLGYTLVTAGDTIRLRRIQDTLDSTRPALTRGRRPFDRRRYAYLVLALSALGRSGSQIALSELADAVAADAGRIDGLGLDTERKADRDAFVDAVAWLEARGALRMADGSATDWVNDPARAEALYDIDREVAAAIYSPGRVLQHLGSVTELLGDTAGAAPLMGVNAERRRSGRNARRLVLEQPVVYYADVDEGLRGQLRSPGPRRGPGAAHRAAAGAPRRRRRAAERRPAAHRRHLPRNGNGRSGRVAAVCPDRRVPAAHGIPGRAAARRHRRRAAR